MSFKVKQFRSSGGTSMSSACFSTTTDNHRLKRFYFFILVTFFTVFTAFLFSKRFLKIILKNVGKDQSGKQINKKHFQNNSNEIDL